MRGSSTIQGVPHLEEQVAKLLRALFLQQAVEVRICSLYLPHSRQAHACQQQTSQGMCSGQRCTSAQQCTVGRHTMLAFDDNEDGNAHAVIRGTHSCQVRPEWPFINIIITHVR